MLLLLWGVLPAVVNAVVEYSNMVQAGREAAAAEYERQVLYSALQTAVADVDSEGGARQMQQDFPEAGLRVYTITQPETLVGQPYPVIRIWATARPLTDSAGASPNYSTGNRLVATAAYDLIERLVIEVRFIEGRTP
jgi:hypothetical protein